MGELMSCLRHVCATQPAPVPLSLHTSHFTLLNSPSPKTHSNPPTPSPQSPTRTTVYSATSITAILTTTLTRLPFSSLTRTIGEYHFLAS